ncbi:MAG TPA: outer membrane protein assembly factor BamA [Candidatus Kapabacteria bacterium]|nr:outer membrane protein assembly factor BamA [Candidatus Kapabacteria bacterium]
MKSLTLILFFLAAVPVYAQVPQDQQYTVLGISVEGNQSGDAPTIIAQSMLAKGMKITVPSDEIRRAINRLWAQNIYSDVHIDAGKVVAQSEGIPGVFLIIRLKEFPRVDSVLIEGNKHLSLSDIQKTYNFYKNEFLRPWEVQNAQQKIRAAYIKEGYNFVQIDHETRSVPDHPEKAWLVFKINEGTEVTVRHIDFIGNEKVASGDLRGSFDDTHEKKWWKIFSSGSFDQKKYEDDKLKLLAFYRSRGFRDATILSDSVWITNEADLNILIRVYEGSQYYIRNIAIVGNDVFTDEEVRRALGFKKGDIYNLEKFDLNLKGPTPDFNDVGSLYYDRGYLANVNKEEIVVPPDSVDLTIRIQEGKRHYFRNIDIAGNNKTKDFVIRRELYTRPGDAFSRSAIIRSLRQLAQLNYFNQEKLQPDVKPVQDATQFDVTYNVEEKSSDTFNASIGYGGALGLTGSVGVSFNNFDLADPLHGGAGQIMSVSAEFGQLSYRTLSLSFSEPWLFQEPTSLGFSIYNTQSNVYYDQKSYGATISLGRRFRWPDDFFRGDWALSASHTDIVNGGGYYASGIHDELAVQQVFTRNSTDDPLFPSNGSEFSFLTRLALLPINFTPPNNPANYYRLGVTTKFYNTLFGFNATNKFVLVSTGEIGFLGDLTGSPFVPPQERFVMGGAGLTSGFYTIPLRGYDDASIGASHTANTTYASGGKAYMRLAGELRFQVAREPIPIFLLGFAEAGDVWQDFSHADPFNLKRSLGLGARLQVPAVGLIGIDLGYGFDSTTPFGNPSGWHTHFQFGKFF